MDVVRVDDGTREAWDEYVLGHPVASFYHQYRWRDVVEKPYRLRTHYLAARDGERLCGVLPLAEVRSLSGSSALVSLPYSNYGGIIADSGEAEHVLLEAAVELLKERGLTHLELKQEQRCDDERLQEDLNFHALGLQIDGDAIKV